MAGYLPNPLPMPSPQSSPASGRGGKRKKQLLTPAGEGANESLREFFVTVQAHATPQSSVSHPLRCARQT
ncbi:MAG: hypothetical protein Q7S46_08325, partial [Gallionella sp.]|nr:hypothetical protein [Gallionella sp.]